MRTNPLKTMNKRLKSVSRQTTIVKIGNEIFRKTEAKKNEERRKLIDENTRFFATMMPNPYDFF